MPDVVHISKIALTDFRNYRTLALDLAPGAVVLTGENGAGKTNLLEAISFLSPGRGLRRATYSEVTREDAGNGFAVSVTLDGPRGEWSVGTGTIGGEGGAEPSRRVRINGANARSADELLDIVRVIWLTPAMDALFTGPAADRRRFLDRLVLAIDTHHGQRALDYEKAMRGRNRLLTENASDKRWFDAIETQMAETGVAIAAARAEMVRLLTAMIERQPSDGPFPRAELALEGSLERLVHEMPAVEIEEVYRRALADGRERDRAAGRTLEGPHRSDLLVRHGPKQMAAEYCSTGEQKALLVGIVLSHARLSAEMSGITPILLLDEIAAHLDPGRRAALFGILEELGSQCFMTGTEHGLFSALEGTAQFLTVDHGQVSPAG
ncbi:MAG: DNA replication/repair protein RecF [Rhizobiaceae bacterium]